MTEKHNQVADLSEQLDKVLQRNSEREEQVAALQQQVTHMAPLLQDGESLVGPGYIGIAPAYGTNNYIMPKFARRG